MWMISMKAVLDIVSQYCPDDDGSCSKAGVDLREMLDEIEGLDETEAQPVKHGRWELVEKDGCEAWWYCTNCQEAAEAIKDYTPQLYDKPLLSAFCPNCGARMDGESE